MNVRRFLVAATIALLTTANASADVTWSGFARTWTAPFTNRTLFTWKVDLTASESKEVVDWLDSKAAIGGASGGIMAVSGYTTLEALAPFVGGVAGVLAIANLIVKDCSANGTKPITVYGWSNSRATPDVVLVEDANGNLVVQNRGIKREQIYVPVTCVTAK